MSPVGTGRFPDPGIAFRRPGVVIPSALGEAARALGVVEGVSGTATIQSQHNKGIEFLAGLELVQQLSGAEPMSSAGDLDGYGPWRFCPPLFTLHIRHQTSPMCPMYRV